jgi:membrane protease YdiL (CAAX protease family)
MIKIGLNRRLLDAWVSIAICLCIHLIVVQRLVPIFESKYNTLPWTFCSYCLIALAFLVPLTYLAIRYGPIKGLDFSLQVSDFLIIIFSGMVLFILVAVFTLRFGIRVDPTFSYMLSMLPSPQKLIILIIVILSIPFLEESFFRRYIFELFRTEYQLPIALLLTAVSETILHYGYRIEQTAFIFVFSIGLTAIYSKSRLITVIIIHILINLLVSLP